VDVKDGSDNHPVAITASLYKQCSLQSGSSTFVTIDNLQLQTLPRPEALHGRVLIYRFRTDMQDHLCFEAYLIPHFNRDMDLSRHSSHTIFAVECRYVLLLIIDGLIF